METNFGQWLDSVVNDNSLIKEFDTLKEKYSLLFVKKYFGEEASSTFWQGNVFYINDYYFGFMDIVYAINNNVGENNLFEWYDYSLLAYEYDLSNITLEHYMCGYRPFLKDDLEKLSKLQSQIIQCQEEYDTLLEKLKAQK